MTGLPRRIILSVLLGIGIGLAIAHPCAYGQHACRVVQRGKQVELCSPSFVFRLNTVSGLRAQSWTNLLTGRTVELGDGPELEIDLGLPDHPLQTPTLEVSAVQVKDDGESGEVAFTLAAKNC